MRPRDRAVLLSAIDQLKLQVARLETKVDLMQPPPPPASSGGNALPTAGGIIGLCAGAITAYAQLTGKA